MMNMLYPEVPRPKEHTFKVEAIKIEEEEVPETEVSITVFSNRLFVVITQINKMGTMITGELENPKADEFTEKTFEIRTVFGSCDRQSYEIYCRSILELFNSKEFLPKDESKPRSSNSFQSPLMDKMILLSISLKKFINEGTERKVFKHILDAFKANLKYLF